MLDKELASYGDRFATAGLLKAEMIKDEKERIKAERVAEAKLELLKFRPGRNRDKGVPWDSSRNDATYYDDRSLGYQPEPTMVRRMLEGSSKPGVDDMADKNLFEVMDNERFKAADRRRKLAALSDPFQAQMMKTKLSIAGISGNRRDLLDQLGGDVDMGKRPAGGDGQSAHDRTFHTDYDADMRLPPLSENNYNSTANLVNQAQVIRMNEAMSTRSFKPYQRKG